MPHADRAWLGLAIALGIGLLIGVERERRKGEGPTRVSAGIRTFAVTSLLGASAVLTGGNALLTVAAVAVAAFAVVSYWRSLAEDPGTTTGVALVLTLLLGGLAMRDAPVAAALGVTVAVLLASKSWMHTFVRQVITQAELRDALVLAAATLVILPLIPDRYIGPFNAFNPRTTWIVVILMMAVGALGHVAQRLLGAGVGLAAAGLVSGFVSSIATIGSMGERARHTPLLMRPAAAGAVLSTVATVVQMAAVLGTLSIATLQASAAPLLAAGMAAAGYGAVFAVRTVRDPPPQAPDARHAFSLGTALVLAVTISVVTILAAALEAGFGARGLIAAAALAGFVDAHAAAASVASLVAAGRLPAGDAVVPILVGLTTNTVTKAVVAFATGKARFAGQIVPGLVLLLTAAWAAFMLMR